KVYPTDIKKIIIWYNLLVDAGLTDFSEPEAVPQKDDKGVKQENEATKKTKTTASAAIHASKSVSTPRAAVKKTPASVKK
ncbi:MAG: hypothetical protein LBS16_06920, partial [Prevotellaceae bacterium]|nr:hypothetical protein [Prevotellaceae bacterium]